MTDEEIIAEIVQADLDHAAKKEAGLVPEAEAKAYEARRAGLIQALDEARGTADVTYEQFRQAFDAGADCPALFELRNRMHPKDPLKKAANEDLRSVGCSHSKAQRQPTGLGESG